MNTEIEARKRQWRDVCNEYAEAFAKKHDIDIDYELKNGYLWIGDNPGTICEMADMFIGMEELRYDVDNDIPEETFYKWYWKSVDVYELTGQKYMNYENYCKGCPDKWPDEKLNRLRELHKKKQEAEKALEDEIEKIKRGEF